MSRAKDIEKVLTAAPVVRCPGCWVEMTLRKLDPPKPPAVLYTGTYRCPQCTTETTRQFKADP